LITSFGRSAEVPFSEVANVVVALPPPVSLRRQPKFADEFLISASTSTVTVALFAVLPVAPVVNEVVAAP
jgi:hypothetical protein